MTTIVVGSALLRQDILWNIARKDFWINKPLYAAVANKVSIPSELILNRR
jgi:hypothetical protein